MTMVWIPPLMRDLTGGQEKVHAPGKTVREVVVALDGVYPGVRDRLCEGDRLVPGVAVWVDDRLARLGLRAAVGAQSEIRFLPAVAGG